MNKERLSYIDIAKCIGIVCIVIGHALTVGTPLRRWVFAFHVPFFFILSGLTFHSQESWSFIKKTARRYLIPYYVASIISILVYTLFASRFVNIDVEQRSIIRNVAGMLIGNSKYGYMVWNRALWFIPCFFVTICLFNVIVNVVSSKIEDTDSRQVSILLLSIVVSMVGYIISNIIKLWLPFQIETALFMTGFVGLGYILQPAFRIPRGGGTGVYIPAHVYEHRKLWIPISIAAIIIGCWLSFYNSGIGVRTDTYGNIVQFIINELLISGGVLGISFCIRNNNLMEYIGQHTLFIMLFHRLGIMAFSALPITRGFLKDTHSFKAQCIAILVSTMVIGICLIAEYVWNKITIKVRG